jgi:hypothetical protein
MCQLKYYVCRVDCLLAPGIDNLIKKWKHTRMPAIAMELKNAALSKSDKEFLKGMCIHI